MIDRVLVDVKDWEKVANRAYADKNGNGDEALKMLIQ